MRIPLLSLFLLLALPTLALAQSTLVVNPAGHFAFQAVALDGVNCGATGERAFVTIGEALAAARADDTVLVCPGRYAEEVVIQASGITLTGHPGALLDGGGTMAVGMTLAAGVQGLVLQGLAIRGFTQAGLLAVEGPTSHVTIRFSRFTENGTGVLVGNELGQEGAFTHVYFRVLNSVLTNNTTAGVSFTNCRTCRIQRNTISGGQAGIILRAHNNGDLLVKASRILINTVQTEAVGILVEALAEGPGTSATLRTPTLQNNIVTDIAAGAAIQFRASGAATLAPGRILRSTINCLPGNPGIELVEDNGGNVEKITILNNTIDSECAP